jgi:type III secretion system chaperone SycN
MSYVEQTVADWGRSLGMERLEFNDQGVVSLVSEKLGALFIERNNEAVLIYLVRPLDRASGEAYARALDACHWRHNLPFVATPALRHDQNLLFAVHLAESQFDLPTLERVISLLDELHREVREGVPA